MYELRSPGILTIFPSDFKTVVSTIVTIGSGCYFSLL